MGTRDQILDAAADVMRTRGLARATTKEIARAAGYSEATLYKHFDDKPALFLAVLHERLPSFQPFVAELLKKAGQGTLQENLAATARSAVEFYRESFPVSASVFSEPALLAAHRAAMSRLDAGPHRPVEAVTRYLRAEQQRGRIRPDVDCAAAASLLLGACLQHAFLSSFAGRHLGREEAEAYADSIARTLVAGLTDP
ncbi:MAG TPA: helix-turn-helix domain-containing protein [Streptosporangiaceae bacterium]|nr:helix-turn-helix domain-containing protein [Streptosporangiaceae bacterium]